MKHDSVSHYGNMVFCCQFRHLFASAACSGSPRYGNEKLAGCVWRQSATFSKSGCEKRVRLVFEALARISKISTGDQRPKHCKILGWWIAKGLVFDLPSWMLLTNSVP
jgi:hypothetical protein